MSEITPGGEWSMSKRYRVVQWGTGAVGIEALERIVDHPELELVGVRVYSDRKAGQDAGALLGRDPVGVVATQDVDAILAMKPDCACYAASDQLGANDYADDLCMLLAAGVNVVSLTMTKLAYPPMLPEVAGRLEAACAEGGSSFLYSGVNPGFATDVLPLLLTSGVNKIDAIEITEYVDASTYLDALLLQEGLGIGLTPEQDAEGIDVKLSNLQAAWTPAVRLLAETLGAKIDDVQHERTLILAERGFDVLKPVLGHHVKGVGPVPGLRVEQGTVEAFHVKIDFIVNGVPRITYHEYVRVAPEIGAPWPAEWPQPPGGIGGYYVTVRGNPTVNLALPFDTPSSNRWEEGDGIGGALVFASVRAANTIPVVCAAAPGVHTPLTLGLDVRGTVHW